MFQSQVRQVAQYTTLALDHFVVHLIYYPMLLHIHVGPSCCGGTVKAAKHPGADGQAKQGCETIATEGDIRQIPEGAYRQDSATAPDGPGGAPESVCVEPIEPELRLPGVVR